MFFVSLFCCLYKFYRCCHSLPILERRDQFGKSRPEEGTALVLKFKEFVRSESIKMRIPALFLTSCFLKKNCGHILLILTFLPMQRKPSINLFQAFLSFYVSCSSFMLFPVFFHFLCTGSLLVTYK